MFLPSRQAWRTGLLIALWFRPVEKTRTSPQILRIHLLFIIKPNVGYAKTSGIASSRESAVRITPLRSAGRALPLILWTPLHSNPR
jgi:hypothetical protein